MLVILGVCDGELGYCGVKAKASEVVESAQTKGPQEITRHGKQVALLISPEGWEKMNRTPERIPESCLNFPGVRRSSALASICAGRD